MYVYWHVVGMPSEFYATHNYFHENVIFPGLLIELSNLMRTRMSNSSATHLMPLSRLFFLTCGQNGG